MSNRSTTPAPSSEPSLFGDLAVATARPSGRLTAPPGVAKIPLATARERASRAAHHLAGDRRVRLIYLFGSTAAGDRAAVGDVDLGILTRPALNLRELLALRADAAASAGAGLDLVPLNGAPVVLAWEVVRHGECLYAADPAEELDFLLRTQRGYWDFKPFLETQWRLTARRLEERQRRGSQA